jgi:CEP19-like protein
VLEYLQKRHPLYFCAGKISEEQTVDLVNRLKFKIKQMGILQAPNKEEEVKPSPAMRMGTTAKKENFMREPSKQPIERPTTSTLLGPLPSLSGNNGFKSGSQLPSITPDSNSKPFAASRHE